MAPPSPSSLTSSGGDLISVIEEMAIVVLRNRPTDIYAYLADYLLKRDRGEIPAPGIPSDPVAATALGRLYNCVEREAPAGQNVRSHGEQRVGASTGPLTAGVTQKGTTNGNANYKNTEKASNGYEHAQKGPASTPPMTIETPKAETAQFQKPNQAVGNPKSGMLKAPASMTPHEDFLAGAKGNHVVADPKHHEGKSPPASSKPPPQTGDPNRDVGQAVRARASPLAPFRQARPRVPLPRPQAQLRLRQRQREEIQMEPFLRGYLPNPKFYGSQLSLMRQILTGEVEILEAPFHAAIVGWMLIGILILLALAFKRILLEVYCYREGLSQ